MNKDYFENLKNKIYKKKAIISIIGLGYVGLPLLKKFTDQNFKVIGFDSDKKKINLLKNKKTYIDYIQLTQKNFAKLIPTCDPSDLRKADIIIFCLPTPLNKNKEPDLSIIKNVFQKIKLFCKQGQLLILESTSYPGTTEEIFIDGLKNKFKFGINYFVGYSPEREDPGNKTFNISNIIKIVSGYTAKCRLLTNDLYKQLTKTHPVSSLKTAEMTKLFENIFRSVNIGLVNELKILLEKMHINIYEVIDAASTKPFGFMPFFPGPGLGGHCIPIDPFYLTWKAKEFDTNTRFIELAGEINGEMPYYVFKRTTEALNNHNKSLKNSKILIIGISYKKNIDDIRESPSLKIIDLLLKSGAKVSYSDKYFSNFPKNSHLKNLKIKNFSITKKNLNFFDACIIVTDHDYFDYDLILSSSKLIIDSRGRYKIKNKKVYKA
jgi:UDP-N-acetyl-D-glucosamine dehydrogenase